MALAEHGGMATVLRTSEGWLIDHRDFAKLWINSPDTYTEEYLAVAPAETDVKQQRIADERASELNAVENGLGVFSGSTGTGNRNSRTCNCVEKEIAWKLYKLKSVLFDIIAPFKMDTQCKAMVASQTEVVNEIKDARKIRKRKRKEPLNTGEELAAKFHLEVQDKILHAFNTLMMAARQTSYFDWTFCGSHLDNNTTARAAARLTGPGDVLGEKCWETRFCDVANEIVCIAEDGYHVKSLDEFCNKIFRNESETVTTILEYESQKYYIPPECTFIMSDVIVFKKISKGIGNFDLIVLDPPWLNKSVKRKRTYFSLQNTELLNIPLPDFMRPNCLVIVWVTNRCTHLDFVRNQLFKKFNITYLATWFWLKVTKTGEMVYNINSDHKKPYETLIIGKLESASHLGNSGIEESKLIVSVPCSLHSKKPPLTEVLKEYLPENPKCLELFARNLLPGWTSWGNEVLLHQHEDFYEEIT